MIRVLEQGSDILAVLHRRPHSNFGGSPRGHIHTALPLNLGAYLSSLEPPIPHERLDLRLLVYLRIRLGHKARCDLTAVVRHHLYRRRQCLAI